MRLQLILVACGLSVLLVGAARADFSVEGGAGNLVVVAEDASRAAVIDELLTMLGIEAAGEEVTDGVISGRYEGELSRVLHQLAPDNGFVIGHAGGQPRRVVFSGIPALSTSPATVPDPVPQAVEMPSSPFEPVPADETSPSPTDQPEEEWTVPPPEVGAPEGSAPVDPSGPAIGVDEIRPTN